MTFALETACLRAIAAEPGATTYMVAAVVGRSACQIGKVVARLGRAGLVSIMDEPPPATFELTRAGWRVLREVPPERACTSLAAELRMRKRLSLRRSV